MRPRVPILDERTALIVRLIEAHPDTLEFLGTDNPKNWNAWSAG